MSETSQKETLGFQTEVKQLLHLMIHSLYSNKEIFLRELISNASDACDKLRFEALSDDSLLAADPDLNVRLEFDKEAKTLSIIDNGIGMDRQEVIDHLGTIAKSGTAQFLSQLTGDQQQDSQLIGQFGVGFYSSFIVADRVEVFTRRAGASADQGVHWDSKGEGEFSIEQVEKADRGTTIVLHLKEDDVEFADGYRLRTLVKKYSDHISIPVVMKSEPMPSYDEEGNEKPSEEAPQDETINSATALWTRSRSDISDEEYTEFYKHISHDFEDPLTWSHNRVEGKLDYTSLLFIPAKAPFDLWQRDGVRGLKLYVQRVFIMDEAEQFLPMYLRFVKGTVDSNDLSLNVSREILQSDKNIESMRAALTKRVLDMLGKMAKNDGEKYEKFWNEFGQVLKEGPGEDFGNKEKIGKLLRFATTQGEGSRQIVGLEDYVSRMVEGQNKIFYITGESHDAIANSPHLEVFRKKGIEVLLLADRVDEWLMSHLQEFDGKSFQDVTKGELDLGETETEEEKTAKDELTKTHEDLVKRVSDVIGDKVDTVRVTTRLTDSPACLVAGQFDMNEQMRKIMEMAGQAAPESKRSLEINPDHPLIGKLDSETDEDRFKELAELIYDQAVLAEGGALAQPAQFVQRLNKLLLEMSK